LSKGNDTVSTADGAATQVPPRPATPRSPPSWSRTTASPRTSTSGSGASWGATPTFTELGVFSAMWSEHCGYKNSKRLLRLLPTEAPWVIQGPGENAGVIDVGDGYALAFKIESHNHPSAVEPYQGAATGVGGILRDIFTMGARPIAVLDSLRFGDLDSRACATCSTASCGAWATTATASASRTSAARSCSTAATRATRW
jgi:hypothetical protein